VLNEHEQISQAVVLAKEDKSGTKRLIGYVVATAFDKQTIQDYLRTKLPEYMVPGIWLELAQIPLTPNGKIDKRALPDPEITDKLMEYVAPRNTTEQALTTIWQELLGIDQVGINDNFFELGGHSLLAMRVVSAIERELLVSIPIKVLFRFTCISDLSKYIELEANKSNEKNNNIFKVLDV
jgi:acyl carrier protein